MEEAISIKAAEAFESQVPRIYSALADYIFEAFNLTVNNQFIRLTVKRSSQVKTFSSIRWKPIVSPVPKATSMFILSSWGRSWSRCQFASFVISTRLAGENTGTLNQSHWWYLATVLIGFLISSIEPAAASQFSTAFSLMDPT
jgi:hypothetical protein